MNSRRTSAGRLLALTVLLASLGALTSCGGGGSGGGGGTGATRSDWNQLTFDQDRWQ